jgi:hypothetical protein
MPYENDIYVIEYYSLSLSLSLIMFLIPLLPDKKNAPSLLFFPLTNR